MVKKRFMTDDFVLAVTAVFVEGFKFPLNNSKSATN